MLAASFFHEAVTSGFSIELGRIAEMRRTYRSSRVSFAASWQIGALKNDPNGQVSRLRVPAA